MLRRLYFLFPDEKHAQIAVDQLVGRNIAKRHMHAIAKGVELTNLPAATERQKNDTVSRIQQVIWSTNLLLFATAFIMLAASIMTAEWGWSLVCITVMLVTYFSGKYFIEHVPNDHLTEFTNALAHGEILLMVDVPIYRVASITRFVEQLHPEATLDGSSWTIDAFGI